MNVDKPYKLPKLDYEYNALEPYISEEQLRIHHQKHHMSYVNGANAILKKMNEARIENKGIDMKSVLKELSFNIGGHVLHSCFWKNLLPENSGGGKLNSGIIKNIINKEFGGFERFRKEFSQAAVTVEGSGWAVLSYCARANKLLIMQIEKHNVNIYPNFKILMALDVWEHAYYLDYKNERAKFVETFWNVVNWDRVEQRIKNLNCKYIK